MAYSERPSRIARCSFLEKEEITICTNTLRWERGIKTPVDAWGLKTSQQGVGFDL